MTFVFVTPRLWPLKDAWVKDKQSQGVWKDVRAFDASDLEQWLEQSIPAQTRMREFQGDAGMGAATLDQVWSEWAKVTTPEMPKGLFSSAADRHLESLKGWLDLPPASPFVITADSTLEALAFLSCGLDQLRDFCPGVYERTIVVRSLKVFRTIASLSSNLVVIVESSEVEVSLAGFHKKAHTIIVRGRNTVSTEPNIKLTLLNHEPFRKALRACGLSDARINQLARESGRSPTILRRRLTDIPAVSKPPWYTDNLVSQALIPFMFAGTWDSSVKADKEILKYMTHKPYEDSEQIITKLRIMQEPPVWSIRHLRGVISKIDTLYAVHWAVTKRNLEDFLTVARVTLAAKDAEIESFEDKRRAADIYENGGNHSSIVCKGVCDTLVLLAVHGNEFIGDRLGVDIEVEVGNVISGLLTPSSASTWLSQKNNLPEYAEAAPDVFLRVIEADLNGNNPQVAALFTQADAGFFFGDCPRSGMLRALELLAWMPERLVRVTSILARLCAWKINDNWADTPMTTLQSIFRCWLPWTAASVERRNQALERLTRKFPDVGWQLCIDQFKPGPSITVGWNGGPRWRTDANISIEGVTASEKRRAQHKAIELALSWPELDEVKLGDLVERIEVLGSDHSKQVWTLIVRWSETGPSDTQKSALRERIRRSILTRRSRHHNVDPTTEECARQSYALLEPGRPVDRHRWLFQSQLRSDDDSIARQRYEALQEIWAQTGLGGIKELCQSESVAQTVGWHMAEIHTGTQQAVDFLQLLMADPSQDMQSKIKCSIGGFLAKFAAQHRVVILADLITRIKSDKSACIRLLDCAPFDNYTWHLVDQLDEMIQRRYWETVTPQWGQHGAATAKMVDKLLEAGRPGAAFYAAHMDWKYLDSPRLIRLLTRIAVGSVEPSIDDRLHLGYYVSEALHKLEQRGDTSRNDLARLEFWFIEVLDSSDHGIPNLEERLAESPELFMYALLRASKCNDGDDDLSEWRLSDSANETVVKSAARHLFTIAGRTPGTRADGSIDIEKLRGWIDGARSLARLVGLAKIGDQKIGQLLSRCQCGKDGVWPCEAVREAIDEIGSEDIATGVLVGICEARGAVMREEGGKQERVLVEMYETWAHALEVDYPFVADMLKKIAADYRQQAEYWDYHDGVEQRLEHRL